MELEPVPAITGTRPARGLDHAAHHVHVLLVREGGRLAGRADRHQAVDPRLDLKVDQRSQVVIGDLLLPERGHKGGEGAGEGAQLHGIQVGMWLAEQSRPA